MNDLKLLEIEHNKEYIRKMNELCEKMLKRLKQMEVEKLPYLTKWHLNNILMI